MKKIMLLLMLSIVSLIVYAEDLSKHMIWQMGGNASVDTKIKLKKNAEWIATPGFGNGLEFFGDGSFAQVPDFPVNQIGKDVTIAFFFRCHDLNPKDEKKAYQTIFSYKYQWLCRVEKNGKVSAGLSNETGDFKNIRSLVKIKPKTWHHMAIVWSSQNSTFSLYIDGIRVGVRSDDISPLKKLRGYKFIFGKDLDGFFYNGVVADFRIYDRPLSIEEIKKLATKTEVPFAAHPNFRNLYTFITEPISNVPINPETTIDAEYLGKVINFTATPGEYEPASFVLRSTTDFEDVCFKLSDLKGESGIIPSSALDLKIVKCWYQGPAAWRNEAPGKNPAVMVPELLLNDYNLVLVDEKQEKNFLRYGKGDKAEYKDVTDRTEYTASWRDNLPLSEHPIYDAQSLKPLPLRAGKNQQFFLTLHVPENVKTGNYSGNIIVKSKDMELAKLTIKVRVLPFKLAEAGTYYNPKKPYITSVYYNSLLRGKESGISYYYRNPDQMLNEMKNLLAHGVKYPTSMQLNVGDIDKAEYQKLFREVLRLRKKSGLSNKPLYLVSNNRVNSRLPATPEGLKKITARAKLVMDIVEEELGHRDVYFYGVDEVKGDALKAEIAYFNAIKDSGAKVFCSGFTAKIHPPGTFSVMGKVQDLFICAAESTREEAAKWHSEGHDIWCYAYPQAGNENPEIFRRRFGLIVYKSNYDGSATFCYFMNFGHPWNDFDSNHQRDINFVYPTADGIVDTIAFEGYREGYDDICYATTLKLECQEAKSSGDPKRIAAAEEAEKFLEQRDVYHENLSETRNLIIERILKLRDLAGKNAK